MNVYSDSDEDDCDGYFLLPVNEYNIKDKIVKANEQLLESPVLLKIDHQPRVTFRAELVDYEPECSSDDGYVDSFEAEEVISNSDQENYAKLDKTINCSPNTMINNSEDVEFIPEDRNEDINCVLENSEINYDQSIERDVETISDVLQTASVQDDNEEFYCDDFNSENIAVDFYEDSEDTSGSTPNLKIINTGIESFQNLSNERLSITLCNGHGRRYNRLITPVLKLKHRYCCESDLKKYQKLPKYDGHISEYGLSKTQLDLLEQRKEKHKNKTLEDRMKILEDQQKRCKQNEDAFANWLKSKLALKKNRYINKYQKYRK